MSRGEFDFDTEVQRIMNEMLAPLSDVAAGLAAQPYTAEEIDWMRQQVGGAQAFITRAKTIQDQRSSSIKARLEQGPRCARCLQKPRSIEAFRYRICCWRTECYNCGRGSFLSAGLGRESAACCDGRKKLTIRRTLEV